MKRFIISDTHFNHANVIKYCGRPFADVSEMNSILIKNWNETVGSEDIVYHLGDFAFGSKDKIAELRKLLNGRIYLLLGNHDRRHSYKFWQDCGFERVYDKTIITDKFFILSHEPVFLDESTSYYNLYGHTHEKIVGGPHHINCCVEHCDYRPRNLDELAKEHLRSASSELRINKE